MTHLVEYKLVVEAIAALKLDCLRGGGRRESGKQGEQVDRGGRGHSIYACKHTWIPALVKDP